MDSICAKFQPFWFYDANTQNHRQTESQTDRIIDRQNHRQNHRQTDRQTDRITDRITEADQRNTHATTIDMSNDNELPAHST